MCEDLTALIATHDGPCIVTCSCRRAMLVGMSMQHASQHPLRGGRLGVQPSLGRMLKRHVETRDICGGRHIGSPSSAAPRLGCRVRADR